jgi:hypothetical protein
MKIPRVFEISNATKNFIKEFHKIPGEVFPVFTANNSTEGAAKKFPVRDMFKELPIARPILNGFAWK